MGFFLMIYVLGLIAFGIHVSLLPGFLRTKAKIIELFLLYQLVFSVGVTSLIAFCAMTFYDTYVAQSLGWPTCPFEQELANVNLSFGILGILSIWYRGLFWAATVSGFSVWIFADGIQHVFKALTENSYVIGPIDMMMSTDLIVPIVLVISLWAYQRR